MDNVWQLTKRQLCCFRRTIIEENAHNPPATREDRVRQISSELSSTNSVKLQKPDSEQDVDVKFTTLMSELGYDVELTAKLLFTLSSDTKWQIYCSQNPSKISTTSSLKPGNYVDQLKALTTPEEYPAMPILTESEQCDFIENLKTSLRTEPMSFVHSFLELNGLSCLLNFKRILNRRQLETFTHTSIIACIKTILNSPEGRVHMLALPSSMNILIESLSAANLRTKILVLEILGACCIVPGGHRLVLQAMTHFVEINKERTRFQTIIFDLERNIEDFKTEINFKTAIMSFLNAIISYGPGSVHLEFRLHLRYELLLLGIQSTMDKLRLLDNSALNRHLDFFDSVRMEDESQLAEKFTNHHVDSRSVNSMFELIFRKLCNSPAFVNFQSLLFHLLLLPYAGKKIIPYWQLIDKLVQQVVLQQDGTDQDIHAININVEDLISNIVHDSTGKQVYQGLRDMQQKAEEQNIKLIRKEKDYRVLLEEKKQLLETIERLQIKNKTDKLDGDKTIEQLTKTLKEQQKLLTEADDINNSHYNSIEIFSQPSLNVSIEEKDSAISDTLSQSEPTLNSDDVSPIPNEENLLIETCVVEEVSIEPPPPPPLPEYLGGPSENGIEKGRSSHLLKSLNWIKLPADHIEGTIWKNIDRDSISDRLDLKQLESDFSAYQPKELGDSDRNFASWKYKELSVIDGRRAQNCTILLSKLKLSCREISEAILSLDEEDRLPKDMCEQLLKFVPTSDEIQILQEHADELQQMAIADYFLFQMSKLDKYEERLKVLYCKKKFHEQRKDIEKKILAIRGACKEVMSSKALQRLLGTILVIGNYLNRGIRGNANGFRLSSLERIPDTKSSVDKKYTLMHFIADIISTQLKDCSSLHTELASVGEAAKINKTDLENEVQNLKKGIQIATELMDHFNREDSAKDALTDHLVSVLGEFLQVASPQLALILQEFDEMCKEYTAATVLFAEDPRTIQPEEFFSFFTTFLVNISQAQLDNRMARKIGRNINRTVSSGALHQEEKIEDKVKKNSTSDNHDDSQENEFDDLISALRSGEVFKDDQIRQGRSKYRRGSTAAVVEPSAKSERKISLSHLQLQYERERVFNTP